MQKLLRKSKQLFLTFINGLDDPSSSPPDPNSSAFLKHRWSDKLLGFFQVFIALVLSYLAFFSLTTFIMGMWTADTCISMNTVIFPIIAGLLFFITYSMLFKNITRKKAFTIGLVMVGIWTVISTMSRFEATIDGLMLSTTLDQLNEGSIDLLTSRYFAICTNQFKYLMLLDIFNLTPPIYFTLNRIFYILGFFMLGKITDFIHKDATKHVWLIYGIFFPFSLFTGFYYRDVIGTVLMICFIYNAMIIIKNSAKTIHYISLPVIALTGYLVHQEILIPVIAVAICFAIFKSVDRKVLIRKWTSLGMAIACLLSVNGLVSTYFNQRYNVKLPPSNSELSWVIMGNLPTDYNTEVRGISTDVEDWLTEGRWNGYIDYYYNNGIVNMEDIIELEKHDAKELFNYWKSNPLKYLNFVMNKVNKQWLEGTVESWVYGTTYTAGEERFPVNISNPAIAKTFIFDLTPFLFWSVVFKGFWVAAYCLVFCYFIKNRKELSSSEYIILITLVGGFAFSIIHEAKPRYVMPFMIMLFPIIAIAFNKYCLNIKTKRKPR